MRRVATNQTRSRSSTVGGGTSHGELPAFSCVAPPIAEGRRGRRATAVVSTLVAAAVLILLHAAPVMAGPIETYLALGDSIAFGETNAIPVSFGDQGYVKPFANFLATQNGGVRPVILNLAFPGETSSSFFTAVPPPGDAPHSVLDFFNLNYQANPAQSQNSLMLSKIAAEKAAGRAITHVSFSLGRNDLGAFVAQHQNFFFLTPLEQQGLVNSFFSELTANYVAVLTELRDALPQAQILLLNSYNEQAVFGAADPFDIINEIFDMGQTTMIERLTCPFDARLVDIHDSFVNHEAAYTFVLSGGVHPNDIGCGHRAAPSINDSARSEAALGGSFERVGLEAGPLSQWLFFGLQAVGLPVCCVETRHSKAAIAAMSLNKTVNRRPKRALTHFWWKRYVSGRDPWREWRPCTNVSAVLISSHAASWWRMR